jgi:hypothetical protein
VVVAMLFWRLVIKRAQSGSNDTTPKTYEINTILSASENTTR